MAVTFDQDGAGVVDSALVRRLRSRVASALADAQRERERRGESPLAGADEEEFGTTLINEALEKHAHDLIVRGGWPPTAWNEREDFVVVRTTSGLSLRQGTRGLRVL
jgi:hypothetical protein